MLDNILFEDELVLDIDVTNTGSNQRVLYEMLFQTVEGTVGGSNEGILYDNLFIILESLPVGPSGIPWGLTNETIITAHRRYQERISNISLYP